MPCAVTKDEEEYYEKKYNEEIYGVSELGGRITVRVACELASVLSVEQEAQLSNVAKIWLQQHQTEDVWKGMM